MVYNQNLHTHGIFGDGKDPYEDTVLQALALGFDAIGFSEHSYMAYSPAWSMSQKDTQAYKQEIARLKEKYKGQIRVCCGIEFDMYSSDSLQDYDYTLGALHYLKLDGQYIGFDRSAGEVQNVIDTQFHGDAMAFAKAYYTALGEMERYIHCDILAHFDLVAKHNETMGFFDTASPEYRRYVYDALDALAGKVKAFEINTGGIARGYRSAPYPEPFILKELQSRGCGIVISSDCHDKRYLNYGFREALALAKACGFKEVWKLTEKGFAPVPI